jgi:hypothetical protein
MTRRLRIAVAADERDMRQYFQETLVPCGSDFQSVPRVNDFLRRA